MGTRRYWRFGGRIAAVLSAAGSIAIQAALADEAIAVVTAIEGMVTAGPTTEDRGRLEVGSRIHERDRVISGQSGSVVIRFVDGAGLTAAEATDFRINSYAAGSDRSKIGLLDVFDGAVQFDSPRDANTSIGIQTNTAVNDGRAAAWVVIAEEWNTVVWVRSGRVRVQAFEPGRDVIGPELEVLAPHMVEIPGRGPVSPPRVLSSSEALEILQRFGGL